MIPITTSNSTNVNAFRDNRFRVETRVACNAMYWLLTTCTAGRQKSGIEMYGPF
jgi:hypothetical protein